MSGNSKPFSRQPTVMKPKLYPATIPNAGISRSSNHTTTQVSPCPSPQPEVTISVSALLKLSQWCQRRLDDHSGEVVCASPLTIPPACSPQHGSSPDVSGVYSTPTLGDFIGADFTPSE